MSTAIRVGIYLRVSTSAHSTENQRHELLQVAKVRHCNVIAAEYTDDGIGGSKGRTYRPALDSLLKDAVRGKFDLIAVWSIDRLGRSLQHLIETVNELKSVGVDLYLHLLKFGLELNPHQLSRERDPGNGLSRPYRCTRGRDVDGADRHDQPRAYI